MAHGQCVRKRNLADAGLDHRYYDAYDGHGYDYDEDPANDVSTDNLLKWRDRDAVLASGIGLHAQMEADLAQEAATRPQSGLAHRKVFCEPWTFEAERYAYWTRVRGCADRLAAMAPEVDALTDEYDARVARIRRCVIPGERLPCGRVASERALARALTVVRRERDAALRELYPEPMRVGGWRALRFYPQVVRTPTEAVAFVEPQATPEELRFAVARGGLDALCAQHPEALAKHPALATAYVAHLAADAAAPPPSPWRVPVPRLHSEPLPDPHAEQGVHAPTKAVRAEAFLKHLRTLRAPAAVASLVPPDAVAHLATVALRTPTPKHVLFAARVLGLLPVASLAPHADALAEAVHVHWKRVREGFLAGAHVHTALGLLEKLTVRVHHPSNIDMAAAHAHAMAQETADAE